MKDNCFQNYLRVLSIFILINITVSVSGEEQHTNKISANETPWPSSQYVKEFSEHPIDDSGDCDARIWSESTKGAPLIVSTLKDCDLTGFTEKNSIKLIQKTGENFFYKADQINFLVLNGNYLEMGRQYGTFLKADINNMYENAIENTFIKSNVTTLDELKKNYADRAWAALPLRLKQLYTGVSETSGLSTEKLIILDGYLSEAILYIDKMFGPNSVDACSFMAVWGDYTVNGKTLIGRNFDWLHKFQSYSSSLTVAIFKPNDGSNSIASINYAGCIGTYTGINEKKLFLELNSGAHSGGVVLYDKGASYQNELLGLLLDADSLEGLGERIFTIRPDWAVIINIADQSKADTFENAPFLTLKRSPEIDGLLVATNEYRAKNWGLPLMKGPAMTFSMERYNNLVALANKYKGKIDEKVMMHIFDQNLYNRDMKMLNGPTKTFLMPGQDATVYQVVCNPDEFKIWIKVPLHTNWIFIDLSKYFFIRE